MSNTSAIAAATTSLRNLLLRGIPAHDGTLAGLTVTTRVPDAARENVDGSSLNLFLYRAAVNTGWTSTDPRSVRPGDSGSPPMALNLQYMLTAYGDDLSDTGARSHRVLGGAMSVLHDHPLLDAAEINGALDGSDLADQMERVRISWLPVTIDDMSRLWTAFQSQYRMSVMYELTVILIDSQRPARVPLPVLTRGPGDRGAVAVTGGAPVLQAIQPPSIQPAGQLGDDLVVTGDHLDAGPVLRFTSLAPDPPPPIELPLRPPSAGDPAGLFTVRPLELADDPQALSRWVPGFYTVTAVLRRPLLPVLASNAVAFALAPTITVKPNSGQGGPAAPGSELTVTCSPRANPAQHVQLLFGDQLLEPTGFTNPASDTPAFAQTPTTLTFTIPAAESSLYTIRLRVDGIDSLPVSYGPGSGIPRFDPGQQVQLS